MYKPLTDPLRGQGSFTIDHVAEGSRYELYNGHPVYCAPAGGDHASATSATSLVLGTDPDVTAEPLQPDVVTLAKGLGGGVPIGAVIACAPTRGRARLPRPGRRGADG